MGTDPIQKPKRLQAITTARERKSSQRAVQIILFLSILSFLLSNYSSCLQNINLSSTITFLSNLDFFVNRKAIFLFFNAILLFLVKDSGLLSHCSSPVNKPYDEFLPRKGDHRWPPKTEAMEMEADVAKATTASGRSLELVTTEGKRDEGMAAAGIKAHVVEEKAKGESGNALELVLIGGGGGGGDEEEMEAVAVDEMKDVDNDELNRRFEEFIEKVKRQRRMEALQLVML